jgi:phosphoribosylpyrophosphate synthetase
MIHKVEGMPDHWRFDLLKKSSVDKAGQRRGKIVPNLFIASPSVNGARVLLFDDTFTTGGTVASAAHALKQRGAVSVVALSIGRQLRADWDPSKELISALPGRELLLEDCVVHDSPQTRRSPSRFSQPW